MNREAQLMGLTATVAQGLADAGPAVGSSIGAGGGYWWRTARVLGALLTAMDARGGGGKEKNWNEDGWPSPIPFL